jgi:hypothetical protein
VRHVGQQRAERHDELDAQRVAQVEDLAAEALPAEGRLGALQEHEVARGARHPGGVDLHVGPVDRAGAPVEQPDLRPGGLEVEELLGIDAREAHRAERRADELERGGGGVAGVVPAREGAHEGRGAERVGPALPDQGLHAGSPYPSPRRRPPASP